MLLTILIAAVAASGIFLVLWAVFEALLMPMPIHSSHIVRLQGPAATVEQHIRTCLWLRERYGMRGRFYFVDCGLEPEAQTAAQLMLHGQPGVVLCSTAQLMDFLEQENTEIGAGTHQRNHCRCDF